MASKNSWVPSRQLMRSWEQSRRSRRALGPPWVPAASLPALPHPAQHLSLSVTKAAQSHWPLSPGLSLDTALTWNTLFCSLIFWYFSSSGCRWMLSKYLGQKSGTGTGPGWPPGSLYLPPPGR